MLRWVRVTLFWLLFLASGISPASEFTIPLVGGEVTINAYTPELAPPDDSAHWHSFSFDATVPNPDQELITVWFRSEFSLQLRPAEPLKLYLPRFYHGGRVYLNGTQITSIPGFDPETQARWLHPHLVDLPVDTLRSGENTLLFKVDSRLPNIGIGNPLVGTAEKVLPKYQQRYFIEQELSVISATMLLLGGLFILSIWALIRKETGYAFFGLAMLAWGFRSVYNLFPLIPLDYWLFSRTLFYGLTGFGNILLCLFILRTAGFYRRWLEWSALGYAAIGPLAMLLLGDRFMQRDAWWYIGAMPFNIFAMLVIIHAAWQQRRWDQIALAIGISLGVAAFIHDSVVKAGWLFFSSYYLSHVAVPMILAAMGLVLIVRFADALQREENISQELTERVAQREQELKTSYDSVRRMEVEQVRAQERQRIMRDMHDGLGSQLLSSLALVESGESSQQQVAQVLRECIDDMRIVIDTLSLEDGDLLTALGTLRFRMGPRLKAAGIHLNWDIPLDEVEQNLLGPEEALTILRIVQEALSNVLKHAGASKVLFTLQQSQEGLRISIRDNGCGFDIDDHHSGKGLANLRRRVASLDDAELSIASSASGTEVLLLKGSSALDN